MRTKQSRYTGAFGATEVMFTPTARRALTFDVRNCPHCGGHHAILDAEILPNERALLRCPATGGRRIEVIIKLFLYVL